MVISTAKPATFLVESVNQLRRIAKKMIIPINERFTDLNPDPKSKTDRNIYIYTKKKTKSNLYHIDKGTILNIEDNLLPFGRSIETQQESKVGPPSPDRKP